MKPANSDEAMPRRSDTTVNDSESTAVHAWVEGRVQGVFYRASTQRTATELGVSGWVRNLPDGRVEVWGEGSPQAAKKLLRWLRIGPPGARVDAVRHRWETPHGIHGFRIRPG